MKLRSRVDISITHREEITEFCDWKRFLRIRKINVCIENSCLLFVYKFVKIQLNNIPTITWTEEKMVFESTGSALQNYYKYENIGVFGRESEGGCRRITNTYIQNDSKIRIEVRKKK